MSRLKFSCDGCGTIVTGIAHSLTRAGENHYCTACAGLARQRQNGAPAIQCPICKNENITTGRKRYTTLGYITPRPAG